VSAPSTHALLFAGGILDRGFWLYVWQITAPDANAVYYVGRTGDSSSPNTQSPFNRMSQHLGFNANSNVLRRHLGKRGLRPEECRFNLVTHGPLLNEMGTVEQHRFARDVIAAMEKALADAMCAAGYDVINRVSCRKPLDNDRFLSVRQAFERHFLKLRTA